MAFMWCRHNLAERQASRQRPQKAVACCNASPVFRVLTLAAAIAFTSVFPGSAAAAPETSVLLLNSYHKGLEWTDNLTDGVAAILRDHRLYIEYMDAKRHPDERYLELLRGLLLKKYQTADLDVVISSDDHAFAFLLKHRDTLFPSVPIVFCGVNDYSPELLAGHQGVTGVVEAFDIGPTIDLALHLHPKVRNVVIVNDRTKTGQANKAVIEKLRPAFAQRAQFEFLEHLTMPDLLTSLRQLPPQALVLLMSYNRDAAGQVFDYDTSIRMIAPACPVPIYGVWDFYLGSGIVGGKLTGGRMQGEMAATMALKIINGASAAEIPVVTQSPNRWMFDHRQLVRFPIDDSRLPANSLVVNRPQTVYQQHKAIVWGALGVIAALTLLSVVLLVNIQQGRKTEKDLRASQALLEGITANVPGVIYQFYAAADGRFGLRFVGSKAKAVFGLDADPDTFFDAFYACLPTKERMAFTDSINAAVDRVAEWHYEGQFVRPDNGHTIWFSGNSVPHRENDTVVFDGLLMDISDVKAAEEKLRRSEQQTYQIIDFLPDPTFVIDREGRVLAWNRAMEEMTGVDASDILGKGDYEYANVFYGERRPIMIDLVADWNDETAKKYKNIRKKGNVLISETEDAHRPFGNRYFKNTAGPLRDEKGTVVGAIEIVHDITERRATEIEVRKRQLFLETVLYHAPDAVIIMDANHRVTDWNKGAEQIFGYSLDETLGRELDELVSGNNARREAFGKTYDVLSGQRVESFETVRYRKDGTPVHVIAAGSPIMVDGRLAGIVAMYTDITDLKRAEEKVIRNARMLRRIMDIVPSMIYVRNAEGRFLMANKAVADSYGLTVETLVGKRQQDIHPDSAQVQRFLADDRKALDNGQPLIIPQEPFLDGAGTTRWLEVVKVPCDETDFGEPAIVGLATDITERRLAEQRIQESEKQYRTLFENTGTGTVVSENDTTLSMVNTEFARLVGYSREEIEGRMSWRQFIVPQDVERMMGYHRARRVNQPKVPNQWECGLMDRTGKVKQMLLKVSLIPGTRTSIGAFLDITENKATEEELRRLRNYLSNIIDSMPSVLVGVDADGRVTQWNRQAATITGISSDEARRQPLQVVFPRFTDEMARINQAIRNREVIRDPKAARHQNGETVFEEVTIFPLITNGVDGAVIRLDDITERVRLEEMMIQSEKMLSVGGLAAGMAHEINNPLAGILQNTSVLENRLFGDLAANHRAAEKAGTTMAVIQHYLEQRRLDDMLDNIRLSGKRAAAIVKNMLSFARKSEHVVSSHDLRVLLDQTIDLAQTDYDMKRQYDFKHIDVVREYDEDVGTTPCEGSKIQQVFLNIIKNGAEAMSENTAAITKPTLTLRVRQDGPWTRVEIEDNGPGMVEDTRKRIFEPFFTTKPVDKGTGLGLSVSYFIVTENHGGKMDVVSAPGKGTRFIVRLPREGKA